jgi:hypothetical protein
MKLSQGGPVENLGVNFTKILQAAYMPADPKSAKMTSKRPIVSKSETFTLL